MNKHDVEEFTIMKSDIHYLKEQMSKLAPKIDSMHDMLIKGDSVMSGHGTKIAVLEKTVYGNGKPGILSKIEKLEKRIAYYVGIATVIIAVVTFLADKFIG